jgi:hypothetical protein
MRRKRKSIANIENKYVRRAALIGITPFIYVAAVLLGSLYGIIECASDIPALVRETW